MKSIGRRSLYLRKSFSTRMALVFQKNATTMFLTYTLSIFLTAYTLVESRVETEKSITNQYKIKLELLEKDMSKIKLENDQYKEWLLESEKTTPIFYEKFKKLNEQISEFHRKEKDLIANKAPIQNGDNNFTPQAFIRSYVVRKGASFYNDNANILVGVSNVDVNRTAEIIVNTLSPKEELKLKVAPGSAIQLMNGKFVLLVTEIEFITDQVNFILKTNE